MPKVKQATSMPIEVKRELFHELMETLHYYEIMTSRSPVLGYTETFIESDKMHLLALRQICKMCLEMVDKRYISIQDGVSKPQYNEVNVSVMEDSFENYLISADDLELETLEEKLMDCLDIINKLLLAL